MIINVLARSMYALVFGGMVAYVAQGLFHDGWVSAAFGAVTVGVCAVWNLRRATVQRDRRLGRTGLVAVLVVLALCAALVIAIGDDDCPSTDSAGKCRMPRHMNW